MPAPKKEECEKNKKKAKAKCKGKCGDDEEILEVSGDCDCPEGEGLVEDVTHYKSTPSRTDINYSCKEYRGKGKKCYNKNIYLNKPDCECPDGTLAKKIDLAETEDIDQKPHTPDYVYACENTSEPVSDQKNIYRYSTTLTFIIFLILLSPLYYYSFKKGGGKTKKRKLI